MAWFDPLLCAKLADCVDMDNLATKPSSRDDGLVARLSISTNMLHKPDLSASRSGTIVCPRAQGHNYQGIDRKDPTPHDTDYVSIPHFTKRQYHESIIISKIIAPGIKPGDIWFVCHVC